jgi:hypothetical protein
VIDPGFTSPTERRDFWPLVRLGLILAVLIVGGRYALRYLDRESYLLDKQQANHQRVALYVEALHRHHEWNGGFPANLIDSLDPSEIPGGIARGVPLRDVWEHPLRYFSDGSTFLLVSVGRDGEPDGDEVVSDLGWHTTCLPGN